MDRREFLAAGLAGVPLLAGLPVPGRPGREPLGLTTADKEAHVVAVSLADGRVRRRIPTREDPRSIEQHGAGPAVVAHTGAGVISLIEPRELRVRRVLGGFSQPRYTAIARDGRVAYVTDSGTGELAVVDLVRGRVVRRVEVGPHARHLTRSPDGRTLWVALGSSADEIAVLDVSDRWRPRVRRRVRPPFLAHDVGFSPSGRRVWVTAGRERRLAVYATHGRRPLRTLPADAPPQHVTFGPAFAYVASGVGATVALHTLADGAVRHTTRVARGSYNIQRGAGRVLTPSLADGTLTILDAHGGVTHRVDVAVAAHDACVVA
jgi:DNA-binding beta-propeller fold protein YncE